MTVIIHTENHLRQILQNNIFDILQEIVHRIGSALPIGIVYLRAIGFHPTHGRGYHLIGFPIVNIRGFRHTAVAVAQKDDVIRRDTHTVKSLNCLLIPHFCRNKPVAVAEENHIHLAAVFDILLHHAPKHIIIVILMGDDQHHSLITIELCFCVIHRRINHALADTVPAQKNDGHGDCSHNRNPCGKHCFPFSLKYRQQRQQKHRAVHGCKFGN